MRILITGAAGLDGSHLSDRFLAEGHEVIGMDNLITGSMNNIAHLFGHKRFSFVKHNVYHYIYVDGPLDAVLHFASPASPNDYLEHPIPTLKVGSIGTMNAGSRQGKGARYLRTPHQRCMVIHRLIRNRKRIGDMSSIGRVAFTMKPSDLRKG